MAVFISTDSGFFAEDDDGNKNPEAPAGLFSAFFGAAFSAFFTAGLFSTVFFGAAFFSAFFTAGLFSNFFRAIFLCGFSGEAVAQSEL